MDAPLDIIRTRGRAERPVTAELLRPLTEADLALLGEEKGSAAPPLKRLRDRHHAIARLLAGGMRPGQVAAITGYDISRISILQDDPAFKELLAFYREDVNAAYRDMHEQLAGMSLDALTVLRERLEEDDAQFTTGQLLEMVRSGADRTGHGPKTVQETNININLADRLNAARERLASRTIDIIPEPS